METTPTEQTDNDFFDAAIPTGPAPKDATATKEPFVIDTEEKANWFLSKLANIEAEKKRVKAQAEKRIAELDTDYNGLNGRFLPQLEAWAKGESIRRKRKTVTLLQGSIAITTYASKPIITDYATALTTARIIAPDAITTVEIPEVPAVPARTEEKLNDKVLFAAYLAAAEHPENAAEPLTLPGIAMSEGKETVKVTFGKEPKEATE